MPTIKQLPLANGVSSTDVIPVSQGGTTRSLTVAGLLSATQPALSVVPGKLLGRASVFAGGPEPLDVGAGLVLDGGVVRATASDHALLPVAQALASNVEVVVNSDGAAKRLPASMLRGLFSAGEGIVIGVDGAISAPEAGKGAAPAPVVPATSAAIGAVRPGEGLVVAQDGTLSADAPSLSRKLGLGAAASRSVGTATGTVAAGDDARIAGALAASVAETSYFPSTVLGAGGSGEFQATQDGVATATGGLITVRPGRYTLSSNVYTRGTNSWLFQRGAALAGSGQIDAVTDGQALGASALTLARLLSSNENEHGLHVTARLGATTGISGYEKAGIYVRMITHDPSKYTGAATLRDTVAIEAQAAIAPGNLLGRAWGINTAAGPEAGADGYAVGGEFGCISFSGRDAGMLGTPTSKIGVHAVAYGSSTSTAGVVISGNGTTFQDGIVVAQQSVSDDGHALSVRPISSPRSDGVAWIERSGAARFTGQVSIKSGSFGIGRLRTFTGTTTASAGSAKLTSDGGPATNENSLFVAANSVVSIRSVRFLVFDLTAGWAGTYHTSDILAIRGAAADTISLVPSSPSIAFDQQVGTASGAFGMSITADAVEGRLDINVATTSANTIRWVVEIQSVEVK